MKRLVAQDFDLLLRLTMFGRLGIGHHAFWLTYTHYNARKVPASRHEESPYPSLLATVLHIAQCVDICTRRKLRREQCSINADLSCGRGMEPGDALTRLRDSICVG